MDIIRFAAVCFLGLLLTHPLSAQPTAEALIPSLEPVASKAREAVVNHPDLAAFEIEGEIREAVENATAVIKGPGDVPAARKILAPLENEIGPLREIPLIELHKLLGALDKIENKTEDQMYHRAYSAALMIDILKSGNGTSPETAYHVVMISEEYAWFDYFKQDVQAKSRVYRDINGRSFDIWTATTTAGAERQIYFDVSAMDASFNRVMKARSKNQPIPTP
jgi:hypothetical protein